MVSVVTATHPVITSLSPSGTMPARPVFSFEVDFSLVNIPTATYTIIYEYFDNGVAKPIFTSSPISKGDLETPFIFAKDFPKVIASGKGTKNVRLRVLDASNNEVATSTKSFTLEENSILIYLDK